ncbi:hypothetical protein ACQKJG_23220 [Priestia megaterium]|uniref:hypothetical protein n=1 Tax=Priestia TaxID=2800373 RepID=UPI001C8EF923|nr:hypothetical protein [Priestia aryabhattai]MBY0029884.1 hypothetical protein [Priestia aryabhattai]
MSHVRDTVNEIHELNINRDAFASINGYFYQFELTLLHLLNDGCNNDSFEDKNCDASYRLETIEDYVKYYVEGERGFIRVAQIKHHTTKTSNSKYFEATLYLYYNYLNFIKKNNSNIEYLARIFHYDLSEGKEISSVLEGAFKSNENKKRKEKEDKGEKKKNHKEDIVDKILKTGLDNAENRNRFCQIARFIKTESHKDVTECLQEKLELRYGAIHPTHTPEHLYASAVSKLIDAGKKGNELTLKKLDAFFDEKIEVMENFYELKIVDYVMGLIDSNITSVQNALRIKEEEIEEYIYIYEKLITPFIKEKFKVGQYRKSLLLSITPKEVNLSEELNTLAEFHSFTEASDAIMQFLSTLAKMIFSHLKTGESVNLEEWFKVTQKGWLFKYPYEQRGTGVIIGDFPRDLYSSLRHVLPRLKDEELRPDVWYVKHTDFDYNSSHNMKYEHDFTAPQEERNEHIFCDPMEDHFHIQCLQCLSLYSYSNYKNAHNIFQNYCSERGED